MLNRYFLIITLVCAARLVWAAGQEAPQQPKTTAVEANKASEPNEKGIQPKPRISFEKLVHDFGELDIGQKGKCEFRFKNIGSGVLNINGIESTCGCTVPTLTKTQYQPGEEGAIKIDYSGQSSPGSVEKNIYVNTNDTENQKVKLTIKANVIISLEVSPTQLRLLLGKENAAAPNITLKSKDGNPFAITSFTTPNNIISIDFDPNIQEREFVLKPKVDTHKLRQYPSGSIQIELTHPKRHSVSISYEVIPPFEAQPKRLLLTKFEPGSSQTAQILITSANGEPFQINSISSKKGFVKVVSQQPSSKGIELTVQVTAPTKKGDRLMYFSDELEIKTNSGEIITVPCNGLYRRSTDKK
jgi:hypothetical protein